MAAKCDALSREAPADLTNPVSDFAMRRTGTGILAEFLSTTGPEDVFRPAGTLKSKKSALSLGLFRKKRSPAESSLPVNGKETSAKVTASGKVYREIMLVKPETSWKSTVESEGEQVSPPDTTISTTQSRSQPMERCEDLSVLEGEVKENYEAHLQVDDRQLPSERYQRILGNARGATWSAARLYEGQNATPVTARINEQRYRPNIVDAKSHPARPDSTIHSLWPKPKERRDELTTIAQPLHMSRKASDPAMANVPAQIRVTSRRARSPSGPLYTLRPMQETRQSKGANKENDHDTKSIDFDLPQSITGYLRQAAATQSQTTHERKAHQRHVKTLSEEDARRKSVESSFSEVLSFGQPDQESVPVLLCNHIPERSLSLPQKWSEVEQESKSTTRRSLGDETMSVAEKLRQLGDRNRYLEDTIAALVAEKNARQK